VSASRHLAIAVTAQVLATAILAVVALAWNQGAALVLAGALCLSLATSVGLGTLLHRRGQRTSALVTQLVLLERERDDALKRAEAQRQRAEMEAGFRYMDDELFANVLDGCLRLLRGEYVDSMAFAGLDDEVQGELQRASERVLLEQAIRDRIKEPRTA
jgi:hypothetical protein